MEFQGYLRSWRDYGKKCWRGIAFFIGKNINPVLKLESQGLLGLFRNRQLPKIENGNGYIFLGFHVFVVFSFEVTAKLIQPAQRLRRMRRMFAKEGGILVEDYEHFTRQDAASPQSKAVRKSAKLLAQPALKPN